MAQIITAARRDLIILHENPDPFERFLQTILNEFTLRDSLGHFSGHYPPRTLSTPDFSTPDIIHPGHCTPDIIYPGHPAERKSPWAPCLMKLLRRLCSSVVVWPPPIVNAACTWLLRWHPSYTWWVKIKPLIQCDEFPVSQ